MAKLYLAQTTKALHKLTTVAAKSM